MDERRLQFWSLYLTRFAQGFGFIALTTLLGPYITELDPSATTVFGLTIGTGGFREPTSMALFADEGDGEGVASSFGIRELIWPRGASPGRCSAAG